MNLSYTALTRFMENPYRAKAHYIDKQDGVYDETSTAMEFGSLAHQILNNPRVPMPKEVYKYSNPQKDLKKDYKFIRKYVELADLLTDEVVKYDSETKGVPVNSGKKILREFPVRNNDFHGIVDYLNKNTNTIIDYKFCESKGFDHVYSEAKGCFGDWIYTTKYDVQAWVYLNILSESLDNLTYYVVAIDKKTMNYRIYDMSLMTQNYDLTEQINNLQADIQAMMDGTKQPAFQNDGSRWCINQMIKRIPQHGVEIKNVL